MEAGLKDVSKIRSIDMLLLDKVLEMEGGYVLNFSDRTFASFFAEELNIDIDDPIYAQNGGSKGKRLRRFLQISDPGLSARALRKLWDYREAVRTRSGREEALEDVQDKLFQIIHRLEGDSGLARTDAIERFEHDETLDELVASIERDIQAHKPHVALDRLHTYCMKKFAHLLRQRGEQPSTGETLNARAGRYFNPMRRSRQIRPISDKIMKSTVETFELYNGIRNNESLAHDNTLVESNEARFIFDGIVNMLRFVKTIEGNRFGP
jgi:hypothetical protein